MKLEGWIQTDGSATTLQYAKKISDTSWAYMEWCDHAWDEETYDVEYKLANLDSKNWRKADIDLKEYTEMEIKEAVTPYGYEIVNWIDASSFNLCQNGETFNVTDSIQLSCECLFESEI